MSAAMGDRHGDTSANQGGGTALPRPKRPTIIRPAARVSPAEPPPRPVNRPNSVINPNNSQKPEGSLPGNKKLEITVIDAKPISELGFRDLKGSAGHVPDSFPVHNSESKSGTSIQSTQLRSHSEEDQVPTQGDERIDDIELYSRISQKPSAPPKSMKPTIIRPGSRALPVTGDDKPLLAPPPRPVTTPKSDSSLQKSPSVEGSQNLQQPPQAQVTLLESSITPSTNNHISAQSSASHQAPKRPPRLPSSGLPKQKTTASIHGTQEGNTEMQPSLKEDSEKNKSHDLKSPKPEAALLKPKPVPKPRPVSVRSPEFKAFVASENIVNKDINTKTVSPDMSVQSNDTQEEFGSQISNWSPVAADEKSGQDKRLSLAPVPLKKPPRLIESAPKPETVPTTDVSEKMVKQDSIAAVGQKNSPPEQLPAVHNIPPTVPSVLRTSGSKPSPVATRKPDTSSHLNSHIEHKPALPNPPKMPPARPTTSAPARGQSMAGGVETSSAPARGQSMAGGVETTFAPARGQSMAGGLETTSASARGQSMAGGVETTFAPARGQSMAGGLETTSAPARGESMAFGVETTSVPNSISSSTSVKKVDNRKPSQPTASRSQKQCAEPPPLPKRPGPGHPLYHYMSRQPHGIARHDYTATQLDELSFSEGETVILVKEIDEHWTIGRIGESEGMFPATFVEVKCPLTKEKPNSSIIAVDSWSLSDSKGQKPDNFTGPRCKARFDFEGNGEGELTLEDGDVVQIIDRVGTEWLRGQHRGRQGIFPASFVEIVEDLPADSSTYGHQSSNCVSALFDFDGKDGELVFKAGDQITVLSEVNSEWLVGACHGQEGQFPASFISHVPSDLPKHTPAQSVHKPDLSARKHKQTPQSEPAQSVKKHPEFSIPGDEFWESREDVLGFCRAIFDYVDTSPGDLQFRKGDRIQIVEFFGEDWARGRLGQKEGMFPLKFVAEEVNSPPKTPEPEIVEKVFGKVLHDFDGETADDLMIKEGDIIQVEDFADINKHWRWGTLDGKRGMFPAEFVEILP